MVALSQTGQKSSAQVANRRCLAVCKLMSVAHKIVLLFISFASKLVNSSQIENFNSWNSKEILNRLFIRLDMSIYSIASNFLQNVDIFNKKVLFYHQVLKSSDFSIFCHVSKGLFLHLVQQKRTNKNIFFCQLCHLYSLAGSALSACFHNYRLCHIC